MGTFLTTSDKIQHIIKSLNLTKTLFVSSIIIGEAHTGKKSLARHLFPNAPLVSGENQEEVKTALENHDELIIANFEKLSNQSSLDFSNKRIIATANYMGNQELIDDLFAFIYTMPSLQERPEDINYIKGLFLKEAFSTLMLEPDTIKTDKIPLNLTMNTKSLKKSIFTYLLQHSMDDKDIKAILYHYLHKHLDGNDGYREHLGLYEIPLIEAGLKKFGSQLQLSQVLGINRNTLRKKIHENHID
ncbi:Fis family transcriptional regulator [Sulfurovum sp.]|uniref:Fis family transcriptional regulator n=1 Tax=Sulfurovum sp. TaxID=1969726 RepID=UPI0028680CCD|nr:Fis family transcriptional regulator [Sulfurovum sp.]